MGGSSKKVTVGYKYYLGMHMILCHGPIDRLRAIRVDNRLAWQGDYAGGRLTVKADNLFGGESREGGISGAVDFEAGYPTQGRNDYLQSKLGSNIPAFRGVAGVVLRRCYLGINPYLKKWGFRVQRIHVRQKGIPQWYDAKAQIGSIWKTPQAICLALDYSASMDAITSNGQSRLDNLRVAASAMLDYIEELRVTSGVRLDIMLNLWGSISSSTTYRDADTADINSLKTIVNTAGSIGVTDGIGTDFRNAVSPSPGFFAGSPSNANRLFVMACDGENDNPAWAAEAAETLFSTTLLNSFVFNIDLEDTSQSSLLDNTEGDGVPVVSGGDPEAMLSALNFALGGQLDMNPAHIIRECLTDPDWGMGYQDADIDDASFTAAADKLYSEAMGISLLWDRQMPIEDFIQEIVKHISATLYVSRTTGKFVLKLIRKDYDLEDLLVLDETCVEKIDNATRPTFGELTNSITVNYWDATTGQTASLTVQDQALIQMQGAVINTTLQYPGFTNSVIASRVALRGLQSLSTQLLSCTIYTNRVASQLNIGDAFKLTWPKLGVYELVMRVTGMALGDGRNNKIKITAVQDVFAFPENAVTVPPDTGWTDPSQPPSPAPYRVVTEAPYYELVQRLGQANADNQLSLNTDAGYLLATAARPESGINARLFVDAGAGYEDTFGLDFCPSAFLAEGIEPGQTVVPIVNGSDLDQIQLGTHAQIGQELVRIDEVSEGSLTIGRGVLDTTPARHSAGTVILAWDVYADSDQTEYVYGETIQVKIAPASGAGAVPLTSLTADSLTFSRRAQRPYPPGKLLLCGEAYPVAIGGATELSAAWSHRDRLQQTAGELQDTTVGDIGPEAGTVYNLRIYGEAGTLLRDLSDVGTSYTYSATDEQEDSQLPSASSDLYWLYVASLLPFDGADESTTFTDYTGKTWTGKRNAKIDTGIAKYGQSLELSSFVESVAITVRGLHLHFDGANGSTSFIDVLGSGREGSVQHATTAYGDAAISTTQSVFGGASLRLDGSGDYLSVDDPTPREFGLSNNSFTLEMRVRFDSVAVNQALACCLHLNSTPYRGWVLRYDPTQTTPGLRLVLFKGDVSNLSDVHEVAWSPSANTWYHIRVCRSGNSVYYFVNGTLISTKSIVNATIIADAARPMLIGAQDGVTPGTFMAGYMDEFRLLNGQALSTANFTPATEAYPSRQWGDMIETGASASFGFGTGDFTVEAWIYLSGSSYAHVVFDLANDFATAHTLFSAFYIDVSTMCLAASIDGALLTDAASTAVSTGVWHHVAWCRVSGVLKAYLNGLQQWSLACTNDLGTNRTARVGHSWRSSAQLAGRIDDLRVTKGIARYTANFAVPAAALPNGAGGGLRLNGRLRVELESERSGLTSYQCHDYTVLREGYGFNYGELYGGE